MLCDPVCQVSSDLMGLLGAQLFFFLAPTNTTESNFGNAGICQNETKNAGKAITRQSSNVLN